VKRQPPPATRVAIYTRKSTEEGLDQDFNSLDAQREACEAYVLAHRGEGWMALPDRFDDGGFSGATARRPGLEQLLALVTAGGCDVVTIYKLDRLSRSLRDFVRLLEHLEHHKVALVCVTQPIDTSGTMGRLLLHILMSFAEFERGVISDRTRDKMAASRRRGQYTGGRPPLGYRLVEKRLVIDPDEAELVREVFALFLSLRRVAHVTAELNRRGRVTKVHRARNGRETGGDPFDREVVRRILTNAAYIGRVEYGGELHDGQHDEIVDERTWAAAQDLLAGQHRDRRPTRYQVAVLRGLLHCARCGEPMRPEFTRKGTRRHPYYVCSTLKKRGADACPGSRVAAHALEELVVEQVRVIGRDPKLVAEVARQLAGPVDVDDLRATLGRFDPLWSAMTTAERAELLQQLVERVEFDGASGKVTVRLHETGLAGLGGEHAA